MVRVMIRFQVKPRTNAVFDECWLRRIRGLAVLGVLAVLAEECRPVAEASLWPSTTSSTASSGLPFGDEKQANQGEPETSEGTTWPRCLFWLPTYREGSSESA